MENKQESLITFNGAKWLLLFVFYLQFLVPEVIKMNWSFFSTKDVPQYVLICAIQIFAVLIPTIIFMFLNSAKPKEVLKLNKISKSVAFVCVLIGISSQSIASLLNMPVMIYYSNKFGDVRPTSINTPETFGGLLISILVVALLPAIFEEMFMRGVLLTSTEQRGYRASLFISGLFFALVHNRLENALGLFFLGVVLCYVVWMTQSIYSAIIVHFSFNAYGLILDYIIKMNISAKPWLGGSIFGWIIIIISILIFCFVIGSISRKTVKRYRTQSLFKELFFAFFNIPIIVVVLGYIMFELFSRLI